MDSFFYELGKRSSGPDLSGVGRIVALVIATVVILGFLSVLDTTAILGVLALGAAAVIVAKSVVIVQAYEKRALTIFGEFRELLGPGIRFVPPFVSQTYAFDMRTQTMDVPSQEAITRDNSPVVANAVIYLRVTDAKRAFLEVDNYMRATSNLAQTTLRAVLGDMELDDTLSRRREINDRIRRELEGPTDAWGIRVEAVEVQAITPSQDVVAAMEEQTSAERRRRAMILEAQGERRSSIERAQGDKDSSVIRAQGEKQAQMLEAQGDSIATTLRARAAESMGERAVLDKGLESLEAIGTSPSTTYIMPQELTSLVGRYGKHLTGSDVSGNGDELLSQAFDADTRELLGIDQIDEILKQVETADASQHEVTVEETN